MKTAEEILESHLTSMLSRTKESYVTIDEMKQVPELEACVNAIEQAQKEAYNQAIEDVLENVVIQSVPILDVSLEIVPKSYVLKLKR